MSKQQYKYLDESDYYSLHDILSRNAMWNFILGARGLGKTYGCADYVIKKYLNKHWEFIYLRRTEEEVKKACVSAHVDHFIHTLSDGYNTMINEESSNISAGQKQLLTIARAFLKDPKILILDEATSSVDTRTEVLIQQGMDELMKNRTSFVIAHRLSTIRDADTIIVMRDGDIVEIGNHEGLLKENGFYATLYRSQFENGQ